MRPLSTLVPVVVLLAAALGAQPGIHPDELVLKPKIDAAIARGVEHLLDTQLRDGSWSEANYPGGRTGLCVYALLKSGVRLDHPAMRRAFAYLDGVRPHKTYSIGCMMLAYSASGKPEYRGKIRALLSALLSHQRKPGTWGYPESAIDLSNTQYAALGLWIANKSGFKIPASAWNNLIEGTLLHQEDPHYVDVNIGKHTGVGKLQVAGFEYRASKKDGSRRATGTMTTAGVSILKICEIGLGKRMRKKARQRLTHAIDNGLNWLNAHFSVTNPQLPGKGGKWLLYYLYGMERVGALTRKEQFGDHWWYLEGARLLLKRQKGPGNWGDGRHDTCFALLFLRRATSVGPTTGGGGGGTTRHLFMAGNEHEDIALRAAGQQPLLIYINGFGSFLTEEHSEYGLRILRVEYVEGERVLGQLVGNPSKAWKSDTFLYRCAALPHGTHIIEARVIALASNAPPGDTTNTVTIKSKPMKVTIRDVMEPWMEGLANMQADNLLRLVKPKVTASSNPKAAANVFDGNDVTHWIPGVKDATPTLTLEFESPVAVRRLILTQALKRREDLARVGVIRAIEIAWNKSRKFERILMNPDPMAPTEFELQKARRVRKLTLRIVGRSGDRKLPYGLAEIVLGTKKRKPR